MYRSETQVRVHYALTDQMGVVYHSRYAEFMEIGRVESLRQLGFTYKDMETEGIIMPVTELQIRFLRPARYDDVVTIATTLREIPHNHKITFYTEIFNEKKELLITGHASLYFMNRNSMTRMNIPKAIADKLKPYFPEEK
ncbi:MAG TPA: thioesterase family protein [Ginsengibacter sp.]|nr:acyl-CoA thioesterase [Chitinophagaceae bacterium]MCZ2396591.1 acyl-CoA thioesterase [Chitinophagales bacterium]HRN73218.1 thioesterase family protein [Ginsengibacter sp.]HRP17684.1 thioesterase family protein [Ginsengibacter sp.]HRP44721.1 thioesterase family protein [Ginsengibacter sp.]